LRDLILSILLAFVVIVFLYQPVQVEGTSMMPRLENHERIFINKFVYHFEPIQRGDIVVFWYPLDPSKSYIKRVIGLPREWVTIQDGRALVNGAPLAEPYLPAYYLDHQSYPPVHVEPDHHYVLGTTGILPTIAESGGPWSVNTFTAKPCSSIGLSASLDLSSEQWMRFLP